MWYRIIAFATSVNDVAQSNSFRNRCNNCCKPTMEQCVAINYLGLFIIPSLITKSLPCQVQNRNKFASVLQTNVYCKDLSLNKEQLICDVDDEEGWKFMVNFGHHSCELPEGFGLCTDGSYNITCLPLDGESGVYYRCGCHVVLEEGATSSGEWSEWLKGNGEIYQRTFYEGNVSTCITKVSQSRLSQCYPLKR